MDRPTKRQRAGTGASSSADAEPGLASHDDPLDASAALDPALLLSDFVTACTTDGFEAAAARLAGLSAEDAQMLRETSQLLGSLGWSALVSLVDWQQWSERLYFYTA